MVVGDKAGDEGGEDASFEAAAKVEPAKKKLHGKPKNGVTEDVEDVEPGWVAMDGQAYQVGREN